jgi:CubicO group peptidase (beta-lactamase class C family)
LLNFAFIVKLLPVNLLIYMLKPAKYISLCLFLFAQGLSAQNINRNNFIKDSLDVYINRALTNWRVPGAAVCIVKDGKVILMKGYGVKELGLNNKVNDNTLFMIGSNTKAFTATALAMLDAEHKLSLDEKVTRYIPEFKLENKAAGDMATVRDLLCHRLGFQTFQGDFTYWTSDLTRGQVIEKMSHVKASYPFRTKWGYTNAAFLTAGEIIPKVTGKPWEVFIKERIFAPLGMGSTLALSKDLPLAYNKAAPHTIADGRLIAIPFCQIDNLAPAASISSSVNDMSKWVIAQLSDGKVGSRQFIPAEAINATRQPQDFVNEVHHLSGTVNFQLYGLGWFLQDYQGHRLIMHDGGVNGYVSSVTLVPDQHLGIVILTNTDQNAIYEALRWEIMDAFFKLPFRDYSSLYLDNYRLNASREQVQDKKVRDSTLLNLQPPLPLNAYTGKYVNDLYGNMTIDQGGENGTELQLHFEHHPKMFARLQSIGKNRFYVTFSDPEFGKAVLPFTVANGRVTGLKVKVADFIEYTPYDFRKVQ